MKRIVMKETPTSTSRTSMYFLQALFVNAVILLLSWLFCVLDFSLCCLQQVFQIFLGHTSATFAPPKPTVVVVGASFAGLTALQKLSNQQGKLRLVLLDQKDYLEYTPSILRLFCEPDQYSNIAKKLPNSEHSFHEFIQGRVTSIVSDDFGRSHKTLTYQPAKTNSDGSFCFPSLQTLEYDYLIVATGSNYASPIWPSQDEWSFDQRGKVWKEVHQDLMKARRVIVLGAGAVGIELAAEIVDHYGAAKKVTLVDAEWYIAAMFPKYVGMYAQRWLEQRGVDLRLGQKLASWTERSCTFSDGGVMQADVIYNCLGSRPNSEMMLPSQQKSGKGDNFIFARRGDVIVESTLQVSGGPIRDGSIFACGDVALPPSGAENQAFQAEIQAKVAASNVLALLSSSHQKLLRYPQDMAGSLCMPMIFALSLGRYDGVVAFNELCIPGPLCPIVKWVLEYTKIQQMLSQPFGVLLWKIADDFVLFLSKNLIKPRTATRKV